MKPFQPTASQLADLGFALYDSRRVTETYRRRTGSDERLTQEIVLHKSGETQLIDYDYTEKPDYMYEGLVPSAAFFRRLLVSVGWDLNQPLDVHMIRPEVKPDAKYRPYGLENKVVPHHSCMLNPDYPVAVNVVPDADGTYPVYQSGLLVAHAHYLMLGHTEFAAFGSDVRGFGKIALRGGMGTTAKAAEESGRRSLPVALEPAPPRATAMRHAQGAKTVVKGAACVAWTSKGLYAAYTF